MAIPTIVLAKPYVLVELQNSPQGINPYGNTDFVFAIVRDVYDTCDTVSVGDYMYFNLKEALGITYSGTNYYLVKDVFLIFKDTGAAP